MRGCPRCYKRWGHWILDPQPPHMCGHPHPYPREPHLGCEVDAGSAVEEQLCYVEVLVMSCDVEGGESRLGHKRGRAALYCVYCHFYPGSAQAPKSWQDQRTPHMGRFGPKGSSDIPQQFTSKSEVLPVGGHSVSGFTWTNHRPGSPPALQTGPNPLNGCF